MRAQRFATKFVRFSNKSSFVVGETACGSSRRRRSQSLLSWYVGMQQSASPHPYRFSMAYSEEVPARIAAFEFLYKLLALARLRLLVNNKKEKLHLDIEYILWVHYQLLQSAGKPLTRETVGITAESGSTDLPVFGASIRSYGLTYFP